MSVVSTEPDVGTTAYTTTRFLSVVFLFRNFLYYTPINFCFFSSSCKFSAFSICIAYASFSRFPILSPAQLIYRYSLASTHSKFHFLNFFLQTQLYKHASPLTHTHAGTYISVYSIRTFHVTLLRKIIEDQYGDYKITRYTMVRRYLNKC